jgi:hypothetical protein
MQTVPSLGRTKSALGGDKIGNNHGVVAAGGDAFVVEVADVLDGSMLGEPDRVEAPTGPG